MSTSNYPPWNQDRTLKVLSFNVWGLAIISKDRQTRIRAIAEYLASSSYDIVCLQELWVYKDFEVVREHVRRNLPFSRFFHTGALGSGLAIFTRFPLISAQALPYSLSGSPAQAFAGDFFVKKAAAKIVIIHPILGEVEIWNTHMHAAGEHPPDTRQAHRIAQSWQLANAIRGGAAKGRYILAMGDFNSQPWSVPIAMMRTHANMTDSFASVHPAANTDLSPHPSALDALHTYGMTCDSSLNTYSAGKPIPSNVLEKGGKRLDYIFYRQPAVARRRPLVWGYRDEVGEDGSAPALESGDFTGKGQFEAGKPLRDSLAKAPKLRCVQSEVILTERVPGCAFSYSDHFALSSTFTIDDPSGGHNNSQFVSNSSSSSSKNAQGDHSQTSFTPLVPLMNEPEQVNPTTTAFAPPESPVQSPRTSISVSASSTEKTSTIRSALHTLRLYTRISQQTAKLHLKICLGTLIALIGLTIGSAWQPKSWLQPIFTLVGGLLGAATATFLYTGFVWGRWEEGLLTEVTEEMELELRVAEMEEKMNAT
ncbi:inositol phosphorylsphingolipid-phospholipase C [Kwoniella heveanensis BCC8398]|uniref:Inositol phosphorylsphingolipid-phospholipase C n=1 Tax=Kwoniella heveanensis BCC8398 TaxID=1296120 RepID=A0A1B9GHG2_9TREE|nr:inositol phosphorylsphingolipid-phospholipase C [Kwoniella heveanensis BCC8398]